MNKIRISKKSLKQTDTSECDFLYTFPLDQTKEIDFSSRLSMKEGFQNICKLNKPLINLSKNHQDYRIATYNVHYWTDIDDRPSIDKIFSDIREINADILCLQEVSFDITKYNPYTHDQLIHQFKNMGYIDYAEVFGSQYLGARYGNLILSKMSITKKDYGPLYKGNTKVRRGYCLASFESLDLIVCCLHLDVFDESGDTRYKQLQNLLEILDISQGNLVICGDFNSIRKGDYGLQFFDKIVESDRKRNAITDIKTLEQFEHIKFHSCFDHLKRASPQCTVWSNRTIDFIFIPLKFNKEITNCEVYYTINSDHFGIFMDFRY